MSPLKKTVITVETETVTTVRRRSSLRAWCSRCGQEVGLVREDQLSRLLGEGGKQVEFPGNVERMDRIAGECGVPPGFGPQQRRSAKPKRVPTDSV
ncbi:MAG TPA: hypothetical protein VGF08_09780 [Terriglobales bacterium]|jgi:hypothetical protein